MADFAPAPPDYATLAAECARLHAARELAEDNLRRCEERFRRLHSGASEAAHDLNNALAPILMSADLLRLTVTAPAECKLLETIDKSARNGANLVRKVLHLTREMEKNGARTPLSSDKRLGEEAAAPVLGN
jgi:signal transduction histidine kinase